ncbi:hypothetical protein TcasGA2_TC003771 [Tribolium castaneum]|uniref:Uncharacterized protein n=1 Tax=Tribolium castaneum TaxID=7070 RepID=D6WEM1_TRICA|nr:hypothetical protein TcasGA2_TC003771 [Tribolium castaneum]
MSLFCYRRDHRPFYCRYKKSQLLHRTTRRPATFTRDQNDVNRFLSLMDSSSQPYSPLDKKGRLRRVCATAFPYDLLQEQVILKKCQNLVTGNAIARKIRPK